MLKFLKKASAILAIAAVVLTGPVALATAEGQIEGGNIYYAKNVTKGTGFGDPISADKCETVQYRVRIHNPGPGTLSGVTVKATLPAGEANNANSTATVSAINATPQTTTDTATVNLTGSYKTSYVAGSTQLLGPSAEVLSTLPDGIIGSGVSVGNVGVSLAEKRFVQFSAKINCPETPVCTVKCTPETPKTPETPVGVTPEAIASTGPAELISGLFGTSALGYGVQRYVASRRTNQ